MRSGCGEFHRIMAIVFLKGDSILSEMPKSPAPPLPPEDTAGVNGVGGGGDDFPPFLAKSGILACDIVKNATMMTVTKVDRLRKVLAYS